MSLVPTESGEVTPLDPVDFLQFIGVGGIAKGVSSIVKTVERDTLKPVIANIGNSIRNLFAKPAAKVATVGGAGAATIAATQTKSGIQSALNKIAFTTGAGTAGIGLITLTPTGQQATQAAGNIGENISNTFRQNPLLLAGIIIIGGVILLRK